MGWGQFLEFMMIQTAVLNLLVQLAILKVRGDID